MSGKEKCKILKEIRRRIADENDIPYITKECTFQGNCSGTCPRCESELRYLERQLALRASMKKGVTVAAICTGMVLATAGCSPRTGGQATTSDQIEELSGEVPYDYTEGTTETVEGSTCTGAEDDTDQSKDASTEAGNGTVDIDDVELMGDVPYIEEGQ